MGVTTDWRGNLVPDPDEGVWGEVHTRLLLYVLRYIETHGLSPSLEEMSIAMGWGSKDTAHRYVNRLIEDGFLERDGRKQRTLRPLVEIVAHG